MGVSILYDFTEIVESADFATNIIAEQKKNKIKAKDIFIEDLNILKNYMFFRCLCLQKVHSCFCFPTFLQYNFPFIKIVQMPYL